MLKVGLLNDSFPPMIDGVANATYNYANIINQKYGTPTVIVPYYPNVFDHHPFEVYRYSSLPQVGKMPYRIGNPFLPNNLIDIRKKELDIMHSHCPFASSLFARAINAMPKTKKIPTVFTYHTKFDVDIDRYVHNNKFNRVAKKFVVENITSADEVWVVSNGAGKNLKELGYKGEYIVMPNGCDFEKGVASKDEMQKLKQKHNISDDELVFLFVGRMMWYKNLQLIMDALKIVKDANVKFRAFFIGDGADKPAAAQYAKNIGIGKETEFLGAIYDREDIKVYFSISDLLLFPSVYDTSGLVVIEAAACDCASLLIKDSCASEGVTDMVSGLLAEENAESCAKKIIEATKEKGFLERLGKNAGEMVYCSWDTSVEKAVKRYEIVIDNFNRKNYKKRWFK